MTDDLCQYLNWDSDFFGYRIARVNDNRLTPAQTLAIDAWCEQNTIDGIYMLADDDPDTIHTAENFGYHWMDTRVVYERDLNRFPAQTPDLPAGLVVRLATQDDVPALATMAKDAFPHSRFASDPHFSDEQNDRLYGMWIENSITGDFDDNVLVLTYEDTPVSFMSVKLDEASKVGVLRLMSTNPEYRGGNLRLGTNTVSVSVNHLAEAGAQSIEVVAQLRNIAAQRIYQHLGFRLQQVKFWYHKWYRQAL